MTRSGCTSWFLQVTSLGETAIGLSLLVLPAAVFAILLGVAETAEDALILARVLGAALLAIGVTCWLARRDSGSPAQLGLLAGVLIYDGAAAALLAYAGLALKLAGLAMWPAVGLHVALAGWCVWCLWGQGGRMIAQIRLEDKEKEPHEIQTTALTKGQWN